jgi:hypothetical protein
MATIAQVFADFEIMEVHHDPYVYGGISFYNGADCSGWIYESLVSQGLTNVPRTSEAQYAAWQPAPGPGYGIAVFFDVPSDGASQPAHVALCVGDGTMDEEPHTGLDAENVTIPNIPGVESIMGYRYLPVSYTVAPPAPPPAPPLEADMLIESTPSGNGYWVVSPQGAVDAYGDAPYLGGVNNAGANGTSALEPGDVCTGVTAPPSGKGYWIITQKGFVYSFGVFYYGAPA